MFIKAGDLPRRAALPMITNHVTAAITRAGRRPSELRTVNNCRGHHYDVHMMNGFQRFWNKACKESASRKSSLSSLINNEYMMDHARLVSLDRNYFKAHVLEAPNSRGGLGTLSESLCAFIVYTTMFSATILSLILESPSFQYAFFRSLVLPLPCRA